MKTSAFLSSILIISILVTSCMSSSVIQSSTANTKVYIDGEYAGTAPVTMKNTKVVSSCTDIRLEKDGYETQTAQICRDEEVDLAPAVAGFCIAIPWLWSFKYYPSHYYEMRKNDDVIAPNKPNPEIISPKPEAEKTKAEKLKELKNLFEQGLITEEEYKKAKAEILNLK